MSARAVLTAVALAAFVAYPCAAAAVTPPVITGSSITFPSNATELFYNADSSSGSVTVQGTVTGAGTGSTGDLQCYHDGDTVAAKTPVATGIDVSSGSFSANVSLGNIRGAACRLALVPAGQTPTGSAAAAFQGPRVSVSEQASLSATGEQYGYSIITGTLGWSFWLGSLGECPLRQSYATDTSSLYSYILFDGNACLTAANAPSAPTMSALQVDGLNAYPSGAIGGANTAALTGQSGFIGLTYSASFDAAFDDVTVTETDIPMICDPPASYPPSTSSCPGLHSSGIEIQQTTTTLPGGQVVRVTQKLSDVDGRAHTIDAYFGQQIHSPSGSVPGFEFPNQTSFATHASPDTFSDWASGPQSIIVVGDATTGPSTTNPVGAITFNRPPAAANFLSSRGAATAVFAMRYSDPLPAGGSLLYDWSFSQAASAGNLAPLEQLERDRMAVPVVALYGPRYGSTVHTATVKVTGRATDNVGVAAFTVNGAGVKLGGDGTFTTTVKLRKGANKITAIATDAAGNATPAVTVVDYKPLPDCVVPQLRGRTLAQARKALRKARCAAGKVHREADRHLMRGLVIKSKPAAKRKLANGAKVELILSS
jgi:hypothetical protein